MSNTKTNDKEWRTSNAAIEVLCDMGIALHYSLIADILRAKYWHWNDEAPTDAQVQRALGRRFKMNEPRDVDVSHAITHRDGGVYICRSTLRTSNALS